MTYNTNYGKHYLAISLSLIPIFLNSFMYQIKFKQSAHFEIVIIEEFIFV